MSHNIDVTNITWKLSRSISQPILVGLSSNLKQNNAYDFCNQWRKFDVNSPLSKDI